MARVQFNCRLDAGLVADIQAEAERLTKQEGRKVSQAEIIERAFDGETMESVRYGYNRSRSRYGLPRQEPTVRRKLRGKGDKTR